MDYSSLDDLALMALIIRGQPDGLSELYNRYHRLVFSLAVNMVGDYATAEEITLDVFTRVWEKADTYRAEQARVSTWLTSITRYRAIDLLRQRGSRSDLHDLSWADVSPALLMEANSPEEMTDVAIRHEAVRRALAELPGEQKEVLALAFFQGFTHSQIARVLNQPLGTVKTRIRLAMQKLRQLLAEEQSAG